jgi:hypothetical protein
LGFRSTPLHHQENIKRSDAPKEKKFAADEKDQSSLPAASSILSMNHFIPVSSV